MEEIDVIKCLFQAFSEKNTITVDTNTGESFTGTVGFYDGSKILINSVEISVDSICDIRFPEAGLDQENLNHANNPQNISKEEIEMIVGRNVIMKTNPQNSEPKSVEGLLFAVNDSQIVVLTSDKKNILSLSEICSIESVSGATVYGEERNDYELDQHITKFEHVLISGDKNQFDEYCNCPEMLSNEGYSEKEITRILSAAKSPLPWSDDEKNAKYNKARRFYGVLGNRGHVAEGLFEDALTDPVTPSKLKTKSLSALIDIAEFEKSNLALLLFDRYQIIVLANSYLKIKMAKALISVGEYGKAKLLVSDCDETEETSKILLALHFADNYNNNSGIDTLNVDAFDERVGFDELKEISKLPAYSSILQLLKIYEQKNKFEQFFKLIEMSMPYAKNDDILVKLVRDSLIKADYCYLERFLPDFPLLWFDRDLSIKFIQNYKPSQNDSLKNRNLYGQCLNAKDYSVPNELEQAIIKCNYQLIEVYRSNDSIMISLGYSPSEINSIRSVDIDTIRFGNKTAIERLLAFEGNRNSVPESVSGADFLKNPLGVCTSLFPILLAKGYGELIYELYNYSSYIKGQLNSLKELYFKALLLIDEKAVFWDEIKDNWYELKLSPEMLSVIKNYVAENVNLEIADAITMFENLQPYNDLESSIIYGDVSQFRALISDADYLLKNGYSSEEIVYIQEITKQRIDFTSKDKLSIANRLFAFQKNKNRLAEFFYKLALVDDKRLPSLGLLSIYASEERYEELCSIYEKCFISDMEITHNDNLYLNALFKLGRYQDYYQYWSERKDNLKIDELAIIKVLFETNKSDNEIDEVLSHYAIDRDNVSLARDIIVFLLSNSLNEFRSNYISKLYNLFFVSLSYEDIQSIKNSIPELTLCLPRPEGNGILALIDSTDKCNLLADWCSYLFEGSEVKNHSVSFIDRLVSSYDDGTDDFQVFLRALILKLKQLGAEIPSGMNQYLFPLFKTDNDKINWMKELINTPTLIDESTFDMCCSLSKEINDYSYLMSIVLMLKNPAFGQKCANTCIDIMQALMDREAAKEDVRKIIEAFIRFTMNLYLSIDKLIVFMQAARYADVIKWASAAEYVIVSITNKNSENDYTPMFSNRTNPPTALGILEAVLKYDYVISTDRFLAYWSKYITSDGNDSQKIEELYRYSNSPEKWPLDGAEFLAKQIIRTPKNPTYWQLLSYFYNDGDPMIRSNILCHLASFDKRKTISALKYSEIHEIKHHAIHNLHTVFLSINPEGYKINHEYIENFIVKHKDWVSESAVALNLISAIRKNNENRYNQGAWIGLVSIALDISINAGIEREFFNMFNLRTEYNLGLVTEKMLCHLINDNSNDRELVEWLFETIENCSIDLPYRDVLLDLFSSTKSELSEVDLAILDIIINNRGKGIDDDSIYRFFVLAMLDKRETIVLQVVNILREYYPNNSSLRNIYRYILSSHQVSDEVLKELYLIEFEGLRKQVNNKIAKKKAMDLLSIEIYLNKQNCPIQSVYEYITSSLPRAMVKEIQNRRHQLIQLENVFDREYYPDLADVFLKCLFLKRWDELILYKLDDPYLNDIIRTDATIDSLLQFRSYETLRSVVCCLLDADDNFDLVIARSMALFVPVGNIKRAKDRLYSLRELNESEREVFRKVFSVRMESKVLRDSGVIATAILSIPNSEIVSNVLWMLDPAALNGLFYNRSVNDLLSSKQIDDAIAICEKFNESYIGYTGTNPFRTFLESDYINEPNIQTVFDNNIRFVDRCKVSRAKYEDFIYQHKGQKMSFKDKGRLEFFKLNYLCDAVVFESMSDIESINPSHRDYLSIVTMLFNANSISRMKDYLWRLKVESIYPAFVWLLILLEQYPIAYELVEEMEIVTWKHDLYVHMYRSLNRLALTDADKKIYDKLRVNMPLDKAFFVFKYLPLNKADVNMYLEKMEALKGVWEEYKTYVSELYPEANEIVLDKAQLKLYLDYYGSYKSLIENDISKEQRNNIQETRIEEKNETTLYSIVNNSLLIDIIAEANPNKLDDENNVIKDLDYYANSLQDLLETKPDSTNHKDLTLARSLVRKICILKIESDGFSREYFNLMLSTISKEDSLSRKEWESIFALVFAYFDKIDSLEHLAKIIDNDINYLKCLVNVSNTNIIYLSNADIHVWKSILSVLINLGSIDFARMPEKQQIGILESSKTTLLASSSNRKSSIFDEIINKLTRLVVQRTTYLLNAPELEINIVGENENKTQTILWEKENKLGTLYSLICNVGGADCKDVTVVSYVNMTKKRKSFINTIYSGEKIPLNQTFTDNDLINGRVTWFIEVSYYDSQKNENVSIKNETIAYVKYGDESLRLGNISTGNPAKGKEFVGRKKEMALLRNHYSDKDYLPSMLIRGLKRSGKSSIMIHFCEEQKNSGKFVIASVDGQSIGNELRSAFVDKVLESLRINYRNKEDYREMFDDKYDDFCDSWLSKLNSENWIGELDVFYYELSCLFKKKILILLDEMEAVFYSRKFETMEQEESMYAALRSLIQKPENYVSFVFCGSDKLLTSCLEKRRESQLFQTLHYLEVGHMNIGDIQAIFNMQSNRFDIKYTNDAVDAIWQYTNGLVWYAKLIGYLIINNIFARDLTIRKEVNRSDVLTAIQMLINGEIGTDKYDLVDASLNTKNVAIVHAMAEIMPDHNKEVSIDEIYESVLFLKNEGFTNPRNGEAITNIEKEDVAASLEFLEKMQFVDSNELKTKYAFTSELYRLFFRKDKRLHLFEERVSD